MNSDKASPDQVQHATYYVYDAENRKKRKDNAGKMVRQDALQGQTTRHHYAKATD
jgi:hypothetical protein